jgi:hypothetical protein
MSDQPLGYRLMRSLVLPMACLTSTEAHRSGCHRWHSCSSDHGTYTCGDLGYCRIVAIPHENITGSQTVTLSLREGLEGTMKREAVPRGRLITLLYILAD